MGELPFSSSRRCHLCPNFYYLSNLGDHDRQGLQWKNSPTRSPHVWDASNVFRAALLSSCLSFLLCLSSASQWGWASAWVSPVMVKTAIMTTTTGFPHLALAAPHSQPPLPTEACGSLP